MNRFTLLAFAVYCSSGATTIADDYFLRLDTIGYVDKPASDIDPKETILRSIEVIARPQSPFHGKVTIGTQTLSLNGELRLGKNGRFSVPIRYTCSIDTGITVPTEDGGRKPLPHTSTLQTTIAISAGESITLGGDETGELDSLFATSVQAARIIHSNAKRGFRRVHQTSARRASSFVVSLNSLDSSE